MAQAIVQAERESIIETIQKRMDDPNYIPTGPTYGEWKQQGAWQAEDNSMRDPVLAERERCAKIAEDDKWLEWDIPGSGIAGAIRSGK